jgi:hypothetical protein
MVWCLIKHGQFAFYLNLYGQYQGNIKGLAAQADEMTKLG